MALPAKPVFSVQVRELVEFALRRGDLGGERDFVGPGRALAGTRGHQRLQRSRPAGYQKEVRLSFDLDTPDFTLRLQGRIDGLLVTREGERPHEPKPQSESSAEPSARAEATEVLLEEIKTVQSGWDRLADPLHWAQAKLYAYIHAQANALEHITIQLTYLDLDTGEVTEFHERCSLPDLAAFFQQTTAIYLDWLRAQHHWCRARDQSLTALAFPFPRYRPGQRRLAVAAWRALARGGRLFLEAPTGIGKTISVLFPAVKALGEGKLERIFYLTARTSGRAVAQQTLADLRHAGARVRTLTLTAKDKICPGVRPSSGAATSANKCAPEFSSLPGGSGLAAPEDGRTPAAQTPARPQPCDPLACPFARGYYDRRHAAMRAALAAEEITRPLLETLAREHQVCPFELSLDLSTWMDVVICDYNYVFDPRVYLRRHFADEPGDYAFLVDEAHNLVDRARDMFSADLDSREIQDVRRALKQAAPRCAKALTRLTTALRKLCGPTAPSEASDASDLSQLNLVPPHPAQHATRNTQHTPLTSPALPTSLLPPLEAALKASETWLARNQPAAFRDALLELYFRLRTFHRTAQLYDERYVTIIEPGRSVRVRLFCLDPSFLLQQALARGKAAVFFSATLTPIDYYRALLGGTPEDPLLQLPSPFPPQHLAVLVHDRIRTHLKARAESLSDVAEAIRALVAGRPGNYLAYFPSYQYLTAVQEQFAALEPAVPILVQRPGMTEPEREAFLAAFAADHTQTLLGFAVMGGIFGEGIDLVGDRLIGAIIVGVGLPQLCVEGDLIRDYFQAQNGAGFDYAYTFPGMNRVLQATGRVIRSETDRGVVLLIDARFAEPRYRRLFPATWRPATIRHLSILRDTLREFWQASS